METSTCYDWRNPGNQITVEAHSRVYLYITRTSYKNATESHEEIRNLLRRNLYGALQELKFIQVNGRGRGEGGGVCVCVGGGLFWLGSVPLFAF